MLLSILKSCILFILLNTNFIFLSSSSSVLPVNRMSPNIFCSGKLLQHVQMSRIFKDGKYFVDMKAKFPPWQVEQDFEKLLNHSNNNVDKKVLKQFIESNFDPPGTDLKHWIPNDWKDRPYFINDIYDIHLRKWGKDLNQRWKDLGRIVSDDVLKNSSMYSQIYVPHPFILPGGRFREFYYWDTYWIIEGLILSEMFDTAQNMVMNFLYLVEHYGYVPNGGRVYYLGRSQPPLLIPMFDLCFKVQPNITFLQENINTLEKEFNFWMNNRSTKIMKDGIVYTVFQYNVNSSEPRPESYYEDTTNSILTNKSHKEFFSGIKSVAESGWDFSSRWFLTNERRTGANLFDIHINHLAPVCLNSILGCNAKLLSEYFTILGNKSKSEDYNIIAKNINKTISRIFWDDEKGIWYDYNIVSNQLQPGFYASSLVPLWCKTYGSERDVNYIAGRVIDYIDKTNLTSFPGGLPTSLIHSKQQWDLPNGWAPLQYFAVLGLRNIEKYDDRASTLAYTLAEKWTINCYKAYLNSTPHSMYEKYDVTTVGIPGGGGEYNVQEGFGWTNGVIIKFLTLYGHKIRTTNSADPAPITIALLLCIILVISIVSYVHRVKTEVKQVKQVKKNQNCVKLKNKKIPEHAV